MRITFCLNHFMPYHIAGTEVYTWALAKSLQLKGHKIRIVIPNYGKEVNDEYEYDEITVRRYAEPDTVNRALITGKRPPAGLNEFEELIKQLNPDVVHIQELAGSSGIGIYHLRLLRKMKVKVIFTMHLARYSCFSGTLAYKEREICSGKIEINKCTECVLSKLPGSDFTKKILYNTSKRLFNLGINTGFLNNAAGTGFSYPFIIDNFQKTLFEIVEVSEKIIILTDWYKEVLLENGVALNKIQVIKQALPFPTDFRLDDRSEPGAPIRLIFIGRIDPIKGLHLLLGAVKELPEERITLDIYGESNEDAYYNYWRANTRNLVNINWKGTLLQKEVVSTIARYDALVLPSTVSEMSPLVIQEANAAGVPVIGAEIGGIAEQVKANVNGLLFSFNDRDSLKHVLQKIVDDPAIIYAMRNKSATPDNFERVVEQTLEVYKEAVDLTRKTV